MVAFGFVCLYHTPTKVLGAIYICMQSVLCQLFATNGERESKRVDLRAVTAFNILKVDIKCAVGRFLYDIHLSVHGIVRALSFFRFFFS